MVATVSVSLLNSKLRENINHIPSVVFKPLYSNEMRRIS